MALLGLAAASFDGAVEVATVDHGLRKEAAEECALVERVCAERSIPCTTLRITVAEGNRQDRARAARYAALGRWAGQRGLAAIATAHHADDQVETLLMRLNRGSGLAGLAGIRARAEIEGCSVPVLRPLLGFTKGELQTVVGCLSLPVVQDPSNRDDRYDRVRIRQQIAGVDWIDRKAFARSAAHLSEAEQTLESLAEELWNAAAVESGQKVEIRVPSQPDLAARLIARAVRTVGGTVSTGEAQAFLKTMGTRGNIGGVLIERRSDRYVCPPEPPRRGG